MLAGGELLQKIQIKEKLALKMLSPDDLKQFMSIKLCLLESTIFWMNLGAEEAQQEMLSILTKGIFVDKLASPVLQAATDKLE